MKGYEKYVPFKQIEMPSRSWPTKAITRAPMWCSVDLRDGNQALVTPMNVEEKVEFFKLLLQIGFKEIEVGFPSASETEYAFLRRIIEDDLIPDDVYVQVLTQARAHLIEKTFEAIEGAKNIILHFYNSTSTLQRKVVFKKDMSGIIDIAVNGAKLIKELSQKQIEKGTNIRFEYSPESFSGTEMSFALEICEKVMEVLESTPENPMIINLPATVEMCSPNTYADQVEWFCTHMKNRQSAIISLHPHNDRGTAVAAAELGLLAGADRIEGTLFGNGERTGNVDIMTLALNIFTQGIDPKLEFSSINEIKEAVEQLNKMKVHERHPYAGELVFTAFSGSHQDAIRKGFEYMKESKSKFWEVPYLPISPADVGREYEPVIRINSQSGKGGAVFVLEQHYGHTFPKTIHPDIGKLIKERSDALGTELTDKQVVNFFEENFVNLSSPYELGNHSCLSIDNSDNEEFTGFIKVNGEQKPLKGRGNGPIDAFFDALNSIGINGYEFKNYEQHATSSGSDAAALSIIELKKKGRHYFGVGISNNTKKSAFRAIISAINRFERDKEN